MPAPKVRYYSTKDVQTILNISRTKANNIMHMFEMRGQLFKDGSTMRVEIPVFEEWCKEKTSQPKGLRLRRA